MGTRRVRLLVAAALSAAAFGVLASPGYAASSASVKVASCSKVPTDRSAVFRATMKRVSGASRLQMRFAVQERVGSGTWEAVDAAGLGKWRSSKADVASFTYGQRVRSLAVGSSYRAVVSFRWKSAKGKVVAKAVRTSKSCRQGEALPDLAVRRVAAAKIAGRPRMADYTVQVVNRGTAASPASNVKLLVDGSTSARANVPALAVDQLARVSFEAPRCKATMAGQADPDGLVRESSETNNILSVACPFG